MVYIFMSMRISLEYLQLTGTLDFTKLSYLYIFTLSKQAFNDFRFLQPFIAS